MCAFSQKPRALPFMLGTLVMNLSRDFSAAHQLDSIADSFRLVHYCDDNYQRVSQAIPKSGRSHDIVAT
jgi:hypothetical protein